ncbi:MAG: DNA polymerase III subunit delta' [Cellulosilyticaceae bacterium]
MNTFSDIIGHDDIKKYFDKAITNDHLSHSYIFEGPYGIGKQTMALAVAKKLLCENKDTQKPCNVCKACHMVDALTHPDLIVVNKDTKVTKIDTIRENVVKTMDVKPYQGKYKVLIVTEADTITIEGQNAMLKAIEEPPSYGVILLLSENMSRLLPTIKSRCIHIRFNPLSTELIMDYLKKEGFGAEKANVYAQFSQGCIGVIQKLKNDETFIEKRNKSIQYLERLERANLMEVYGLVKELCDQKEDIIEILDFWTLWYRDVGILKSMDKPNLYYSDYKNQLLDITYKLPYNKITTNISLIRQAKIEINQNIYATFVIENLLLKLKERKR